MENEKEVEISEEKKIDKKKKIIKILVISAIVLVAGFILICALPFLWFIAVILYNMFIDIPSKPKVKEGEFPFELVYEYKGEQVTITDTIVCEYDGYSFSLEGGNSRDWKCSFKDNDEYVYYVDIENEPYLYIVVPEAPEYYMGEDDVSKEYAEPYIKYTDEETGTYYEEKEEIEVVDIKIIEWRPSAPLKDNFK